MKGQSQIIQFLMFFLIGLSIFLAIGNFFKLQMGSFGESIADANRKATASLISSIAVSQFADCKRCDNVNTTIKLQNTTANYLMELNLTHFTSGPLTGTKLLFVRTDPNKYFFNGFHKFNLSSSTALGRVSTTLPINISLSRTNPSNIVLRICNNPVSC